ncbi:hypothetical protein G9A89_018623 [Geosiphon pyriformis]|nr:hypothetical protein G9A89_018623 [Geosiphon pyriformis]
MWGNWIRRGIKYEVVPIYDIYGPTVTDPDIEALVVSRETISNAHSINEERRKHSFKPLEMAIIEVISSDNSSLDEAQLKNLKISSTFIRKYLSGQIIDRSDKRT